MTHFDIRFHTRPHHVVIIYPKLLTLQLIGCSSDLNNYGNKFIFRILNAVTDMKHRLLFLSIHQIMLLTMSQLITFETHNDIHHLNRIKISSSMACEGKISMSTASMLSAIFSGTGY